MQNPYTPPQSTVTDIDVMRRGPRPAAVSRACTLMWIALGLSVLSTFPGVRTGFWDDPEVPIVLILIGAALISLLVAWLIVCVYEGRNWARWTLVSFQAMSWLILASDPTAELEQGALAVAIDLVIVALEIYGCILLLRGEGAAWFKHRM